MEFLHHGLDCFYFLRYSVLSKQGKGSFSTVILCIDTKEDNVRRVIKVINSKETMYHFGRREVQTLSALKDLDPENKFSCVRFYESFEFRNHLCMVFEAMQWNARKVTFHFCRNVFFSNCSDQKISSQEKKFRSKYRSAVL